MRSMTGYAQASAEDGGWRVTWTLRSVNHRHLDLVFRLPDEWRAAEAALRESVRDRLHRGRVELALEARDLEGGARTLVADEKLIEQVVELERRFERLGWVSSTLDLGDFLRVPEAIRPERGTVDPEDLPRDLALGALETALERLDEARGEEGRRLAEVLEGRRSELEQVVEELESRREAVVEELATSLDARIRETLDRLGSDTGLEPDRLAQEVAVLVDKSDVREEIDRLASHLDHLRTVASAEGSIGKRLDFLAQEIFRELNTVGAKCRDAEMTRHVIDGKLVCEQIREQVQNVE